MELKKRENTGSGERTLYTGIFSGRVRGINPSAEERAKIIGYEVTPSETGVVKQPVYEEKDQDGKEVMIINFLLEGDGPDTGKFFDARFRITDKEATNKEGTKNQYVSATGDTSWVDDPKNLEEWFVNYQEETEKGSGVYRSTDAKPYRKALQGEADLMNFMKAWLSNSKLSGNGILLDMKSLFRNVDKFVRKELVSEINKDSSENVTDCVICLATVYTKEKDGEIKHYQNLYKEYLPGYNGYTIKQVISGINTNWEGVKMKGLKKWYKAVNGEYGPKDAYSLTTLQVFHPNNHIQASNDTIRHEATSAFTGGTPANNESLY